jgi:hypothetical protein
MTYAWKSALRILAVFCGIALVTGCNDAVQEVRSTSRIEATRADVEAFARMRILFAHQSVGFNVVDGVKTIGERQHLALNIVETRTPSADSPGLFHFRVGRNEFPDEKIADFRRTVEADSGANLDAAVFKLCYIDFNANIDAAALAGRYLEAVRSLQQAHPSLAIVAVTAPLTVTQTGPKAWVKKLLGRTPSGVLENKRRHIFNEALRAAMPPDRLFDLASVETLADSESMDPALRSDGGHLNERGRTVVANAFIHFLAQISSGKR